MANAIQFRVQTRAGVVERTVQPGGVLDVMPGETVLEAWINAPVGGLIALAADALLYAGQRYHADDWNAGTPRAQLLYNFANVGPRSAPAGPFGFVTWQTGPASGPDGVINGTTVEDLLATVRGRLEGYQAGKLPSIENEAALGGIAMALEALARRTAARQAQEVEGTDAPHVPA